MAKPFDLLNEMVGKSVIVGMKGNKEVKGRMVAFDIHMNLSLSNVSLKDENGTKEIQKLFLRGDSVVYIYPEG